MHTAVQTEEYVDPPAPPRAPSIGIADHLEPLVPLIQKNKHCHPSNLLFLLPRPMPRPFLLLQ